jgi:hypothetical protein
VECLVNEEGDCSKLRGARQRIKAKEGREGRKPYGC